MTVSGEAFNKCFSEFPSLEIQKAHDEELPLYLANCVHVVPPSLGQGSAGCDATEFSVFQSAFDQENPVFIVILSHQSDYLHLFHQVDVVDFEVV